MNNAERCRFWTNTTQVLLSLQMGAVAITLFPLLLANEVVVTGALGACWVIAILLHIANFRLTRTGPMAQRYQHTKKLLNHSDIRIRLLLHLSINWTVILLTTIVAWSGPEQDKARMLALVVTCTSLLVWVSFNLQHKKENRFKNILFTSVMAITFISMVFPLL